MRPKVEHLDTLVAAVGRKQHGVVTIYQLRAIGLGSGAIKHRVGAGRLHPIHRGVYAVGHRNLTDHALFVAAVLAIGKDAALSHTSAAALYELMKRNRNQWIHVTTTRRPKPRNFIRLHTTRTLEATMRNGIRVTTPSRTLLDLGDVVPKRQHERAVHEAEVQRLVTLDELHAQIARSPGRAASTQLATIIADGPAPTRSELEDAMLALLKQHGLPRPEPNATVLGEEVDLHFPGTNLVVELDGWRYHGTKIRRRLDARKQAKLEAGGFRVLRVDWDQVHKRAEETVGRVRVGLSGT